MLVQVIKEGIVHGPREFATSQGICARISCGETENKGALIPLKYTWVPASVVGSAFWLISADSDAPDVRVWPGAGWIETMVPGPTLAASPPPVRLAPEAADWIVAFVEVVVL